MFGVCVNFKIRVFQWSAVQLCGEMVLGKGEAEDSCHNLRGPTCIADLDSGALALTNADNRPALLQLSRPHGTAVKEIIHIF